MALRSAVVFIAGMTLVFGQKVGSPTDDLSDLSVDELFRIQVTSVGRKAQQRSKAPAAVFVLTGDDIRRSGATSIPEALKWVPGLTVLSVDGRHWAVSARGSTRLYADKILVMIDGRSLYTPFFSGVLWELVDVPLDDIEQIEVVRGPGAVMWGPNAVNGVINIITKRSSQTKGAAISAASGNELHGSGYARWGAEPKDGLAYRVWSKFDESNPASGSPEGYTFLAIPIVVPKPATQDLSSDTARIGFRVDLQSSEKDQFMVQGDGFRTRSQESVAYPVFMPAVIDRMASSTKADGGFLQARWTRTHSADSDSTLQFTFDKTGVLYPFIDANLNNMTVNYERRWHSGENNEIYWGGGYQQYWDDLTSHRMLSFQPLTSMCRVGDVVLRDELEAIPNRLLISGGVRLDYSAWSRLVYEPSLRLLYTPSTRQSAWIDLSRSVRVPSRLDRNVHSDGELAMTPFGIPLKVDSYGSNSMRSETARTAELGYRLQSGQRWSIDSSMFWTYYDRVRVLSAPAQPAIVLINQMPALSGSFVAENGGKGRSFGGESWLTWQVRPTWRLIPSYSYLNETWWKPTSPDRIYQWLLKASDPRHQATLRSQHDISKNFQFDLMARARSRNTTFDLPGVLLVDMRLGWRPHTDTEFSISGQNLTGRTVMETYSEGPFAAIPLRRTFVVKWTQRF